MLNLNRLAQFFFSLYLSFDYVKHWNAPLKLVKLPLDSELAWITKGQKWITISLKAFVMDNISLKASVAVWPLREGESFSKIKGSRVMFSKFQLWRNRAAKLVFFRFSCVFYRWLRLNSFFSLQVDTLFTNHLNNIIVFLLFYPCAFNLILINGH